MMPNAFTDLSAWLLVVVAMGGMLLYLLPAVIAVMRSHHQALAIFVLNLLLGWTLLGWVGALVWACTAGETAHDCAQEWDR